MTLHKLAAVGLIGIACLVVVWRSVGADKIEASADNSGSVFKSKYVVVTTKGDGYGAYFENPEIREIKGHLFLAGKMAAPTKHWKEYEGDIGWIPLDTIGHMCEVDSLDQFKN